MTYFTFTGKISDGCRNQKSLDCSSTKHNKCPWKHEASECTLLYPGGSTGLVVTIKIFNVWQYDFFLYKFEYSRSKPAELHHICFTKNRLCNCKLIYHVQSLFFSLCRHYHLNIICKDVSVQIRNASTHHEKSLLKKKMKFNQSLHGSYRFSFNRNQTDLFRSSWRFVR